MSGQAGISARETGRADWTYSVDIMAKRILLFVVTNLAVVLVISVVLSLLGVGDYVGPDGLNVTALAIFCLVWGMAGAFISLLISRWMAKRAMGVRLVDGRTGHEELDWLYRTVQRLTQQAQLPMPEVGYYESAELNAFATGPSKSRSLVAVSSGLLRGMRRDEVEGVLAHEVAHIANGDMVTMTLLQGVINAFVMFLARVVAFAIASRGNSRDDRSPMVEFMVVMVLQIVFGVLGAMITSWFSRQREFRADRGGATLAGRDRMIAALKRLGANRELVDPAHPELATLKISGAPKWMALLSTHPPLEVRIAALENARLS
jgi:heat shock protein HtpX